MMTNNRITRDAELLKTLASLIICTCKSKATNRYLYRCVDDNLTKLKSLLEVTKAINNNFSTDQLLLIFQEVLEKELNIG